MVDNSCYTSCRLRRQWRLGILNYHKTDKGRQVGVDRKQVRSESSAEFSHLSSPWSFHVAPLLGPCTPEPDQRVMGSSPALGGHLSGDGPGESDEGTTSGRTTCGESLGHTHPSQVPRRKWALKEASAGPGGQDAHHASLVTTDWL